MVMDAVTRAMSMGTVAVLAWAVVVIDDPVLVGLVLVFGGLLLLVLAGREALQPADTALLLGSLNLVVGAALVGGLRLAGAAVGLVLLVLLASPVRRHHRPGHRSDRGGLAPPAAM